MQAIITKLLPATNTKPTRIKASCQRGSKIFSVENVLSDHYESPHIFAANRLCEAFAYKDVIEYGSDYNSNPWLRPKVAGQLPNGDYVHVFKGE